MFKTVFAAIIIIIIMMMIATIIVISINSMFLTIVCHFCLLYATNRQLKLVLGDGSRADRGEDLGFRAQASEAGLAV